MSRPVVPFEVITNPKPPTAISDDATYDQFETAQNEMILQQLREFARFIDGIGGGLRCTYSAFYDPDWLVTIMQERVVANQSYWIIECLLEMAEKSCIDVMAIPEIAWGGKGERILFSIAGCTNTYTPHSVQKYIMRYMLQG